MKSYFTRLSSLLTFLLFLSSCSLFQDIQIKNVTDFAPTFQDKQLLIKANVSVQNDNLYAIKLKQSDLTISIDDKALGNVTLAEKVIFKRKSDTSYPVKLKLNLADGALFTILRNAFKKEVTITIKGTMKGSALGIPKTIAINETKTIDGNLLKALTN
jgi:LEA14-like dessication related protein